MGSLRRMKSSFELSKVKASDEPAVLHEQVGENLELLYNIDTKTMPQVSPSTQRPSLALNFELTPPGKPMFDSSRNSSKSAAIEINHSSPIAVPRFAKFVKSTPPPQSIFLVGTVPETPAPLQKAAVQEAILSHSMCDVDTSPVKSSSAVETIPTPMPGTNLPLEGLNTPGIFVSAPSGTQHEADSYFNIPLKKDAASIERVDSVVTHEFLAPPPVDVSAEVERIAIETPLPRSRITSVTEDSDPLTLDSERRKSLETKTDCAAAYLALNRSDEDADAGQGSLQRCHSICRGPTSLYDGTGYADSDLFEDSGSVRIHTVSDSSEVEWEPTSAISMHRKSSTEEKQALQDIIRAYALRPATDEDGEDGDATVDSLAESGTFTDSQPSNASYTWAADHMHPSPRDINAE
jgi:hypothetical protein